MPVTVPEPPAAVAEVAHRSLSDLAERRLLRVPALAGADPADLDLSDPHPVYNLGLDDLVADHPPTDDSLVGWRYLVSTAGGVVAATEVATEPDGSDPRFASVNQGPYVASSARALAAPASTAGGGGAYSARLLRVPALFVMALWLHAEAGGEDEYQPIAPAPAPLEVGGSYSWEGLRESLLGPAEAKLSFDDSPQ